MRLRKWYLDLVTGGGEALIAYVAHGRAGGLAFSRCAVLWPADAGPLRERRSAATGPGPRLEGDGLRLDLPSLGFAGRWAGPARPLSCPLLEEGRRSIRWTCHGVTLDAEASLEGAGSWRGRGYAECLDLDLPGLAPPFRELRWGRFQGSADLRAVWIQWEEGLTRRWAWVDEAPADPGRVDRTGWSSAAGLLHLDEGRLLRDAWVAEEAFGTRWARLIPGYRKARDRKWLTRGRWQPAGGGPAEEGWAILEEVRWT